MIEVFKYIGFTLLFLRFSFWIGMSLGANTTKWIPVVIGQIFEGILIFFFFVQLVGGRTILPFKNIPLQFLGFFLLCIGVSIAFVGRKQLGNAWVYASAYTVFPRQKLVTSGMYGIVRHPIYTGVFISFVGAELLAGSWLWVSILLSFFPFYHQVKKEETLLLKHFEEKYKTYQKRTKMLIPFVL